MAFKETVSAMEQLLEDLSFDLKKTLQGNKSAAQRVRTGSIKFGKVSKVFRKQSLVETKKRTRRVTKKRRR